MSTATVGTATYVGGLADAPYYFETTDSGLKTDGFGMDVLNRTFSVRPDKLAAFRAAYPRDLVDATFGWLYVTESNFANVRGPVVHATVTFKGANITSSTNPNLPRAPMISGGLQTLTVNIRSITLPDATKNVVYRAPWTEWKYISSIPPELLGPQFDGLLLARKQFPIVMVTTGALGTLNIDSKIYKPGETPPAPKTSFNGLLKINPSKFDYTQVGKLWAVTERNELIIVDYLTFAINSQFGW